jgi:hypothetical protein
MVVITLIEGATQFHKSESEFTHIRRNLVLTLVPFQVGLGADEADRTVSFCAHTILQRTDQPVVVLNATKDWRFAMNVSTEVEDGNFLIMNALLSSLSLSALPASDFTQEPLYEPKMDTTSARMSETTVLLSLQLISGNLASASLTTRLGLSSQHEIETL